MGKLRYARLSLESHETQTLTNQNKYLNKHADKQKSKEDKVSTQRQVPSGVWEFLPHKQHMPKHLPTQCLAVAERSRALRGARDTGKSERPSGKGDWPARSSHIL